MRQTSLFNVPGMNSSYRSLRSSHHFCWAIAPGRTKRSWSKRAKFARSASRASCCRRRACASLHMPCSLHWHVTVRRKESKTSEPGYIAIRESCAENCGCFPHRRRPVFFLSFSPWLYPFDAAHVRFIASLYPIPTFGPTEYKTAGRLSCPFFSIGVRYQAC